MNALRTLVSLCLAMQAGAAAAEAPTRIVVPTVEVGAASAGAVRVFDAVLQPLRQATLTAQVGGNVLDLRVQAGAAVKRGQPLVRLDDREARAATARSDAAIAQADAELRHARQALERQRELKASGFVSQAAVDAADNQFRAASAALRQAQAARTQSAVAQGFAELVAPFDGIVLATFVEAGDLALPGRALLTVYEPGRLRAVAQVPASRAAAANAATQVEVRLADGRSLAPIARELLPAADPVSQTVEWRLALPADAAGARPGQTVRISARVAADGAAPARPSVPREAVLQRGELTAVYVATDRGFALRALRLGAAAGGAVEVLAGLKPGERIAFDPVKAGLQGAVPGAP